jgi:oxaloacetate decarboxylase (Na+ extruding) subunit gamma
MEHDLNSALSILLIGMLTVFFILWLVVVIGNLIIMVVNRYWPAPQGPVKRGGKSGAITSGTMAAIVAAVEAVTGGKGKVTKIEKEELK